MNEAKRTKIITFRVTEDEYKKIEDAALAQDTDPNDWCRYTTVQLSGLLLTIPERMIYSEIAALRWLLEYGFLLLFSDDPDVVASWREKVAQAEEGAGEVVNRLLERRKLRSR